MTLEELKVVITAETSGLRKELHNVTDQVDDMASKVNKSTDKVSSSLKGLFKGISVVAVVSGLAKVAKSAIDLASDLEEVQNVVDVAFGSMSGEINEFAKNAIYQLGITETQAKQYSSTFMAMANGMGIASEDGKKMSINLTSLAADMASFYNVTTDVSNTALKSVFTGETESLKKFGVVMTEANLESYALSQGITKQYSAMSQAEKVALRYNYVLQQTAQAQGDYARTSDSWANQIRLLSNQWSQLKATLGQFLIQAITPIIQGLNKILSLLNSIASRFGSLFGFAGGSSAVGAISEETSELESNAESANTAAKKLKRTLASFDELNVLNTTDSSSSSSSSSSGESNIAINDAYGLLNNGSVQSTIDGWFADLPEIEFHINTEKLFNDLSAIGNNIKDIVLGWGNLAASLAINLFNDLGIDDLITSMSSLMVTITELGKKITDYLVPKLKDLYNNHLSPIVEWIGGKLKDAIDFATGLISDIGQVIADNTEGWDGWFDSIGAVIDVLWKLAEPIADAMWDTLKTILSGIKQLFEHLITKIAEVGEKLGIFANSESWSIIESAASSIGNLIGGMIETISGWLGDWFDTIDKLWYDLDLIALEIKMWWIWDIKEGLFKSTSWKEIGEKAMKALKDGLQKWFPDVKTIFKDVSNYVKVVQKIIGLLNPTYRTGSLSSLFNGVSTFANGGVLTTPTLGLMAEYPGASRNPEIVSPQSVMYETVVQANSQMVNALVQVGKQVITAINEQDNNTYLDGESLAKGIAKANDSYKRRTGISLI